MILTGERNNALGSIEVSLVGAWENDVWDLSTGLHEIYNPNNIKLKGILDFTAIENKNLRNEIKIFLLSKIKSKVLTAGFVDNKFLYTYEVLMFLADKYPKCKSIIDLNLNKVLLEIRTYYKLKKYGKYRVSHIETILKQVNEFWEKKYDNRDEYEKDIWDIRIINPAKIALIQSNQHLNFTEVPEKYKNITKKYLKVCIQRYSLGYCEKKLYSMRIFFNFIEHKHNDWNSIKNLNREDIEDFIIWVRKWFENRGSNRLDLQVWNVVVDIKTFIEYIQITEYQEAPIKLVNTLIFKEDKPRKPDWRLTIQKYIPQEILNQLEENLIYLDTAYIPIVIILRATGSRICDVLSMKYDKCLELVNNGWYVVMDISKTKILNHRIPITEEVAFIVKEQIANAEKLYKEGLNPNKYLFVRQKGERAALPPSSRSLTRAINKLAEERNIVDEKGNIFHFKNHAFRHTKAVELINNGMNLLHVQKWLAHYTPEMTLKYAQLLDTTLRKSWEEVMKSGLFKVDIRDGKLERIQLNSENNDLIEWEYIRKNLDAVRIPLGYCFKPNKVQCNHQLNPCLTCSNMCTSPEFAHEFEIEIEETKIQIERARQLGRTVWVEKNEVVLEKLESILSILKDGKVYHKSGKQKREYIGDERGVK